LLKEIVIAFQSYVEAHQFIVKNKLWKWIIGPGIVYAILVFVGIYFFMQSSNNAIDWLSRQIGLNDWLQKERNEWLSFLFVMMGIMLRLVLFFFYFSLLKYLILIMGSPVFAYLSEKTESIMEGKDLKFSFQKIRQDAWRGVKLALRNSIWQTVYMFFLILLALVPVIGWITPMIVVIVECYYYGFSMLDYSLARQKLSPPESIRFIGNHKGLAIGNGTVFYLMHFVFIVGWVVAPAYAIIAATLSIYKSKTE
jgi:CysZ protein